MGIAPVAAAGTSHCPSTGVTQDRWGGHDHDNGGGWWGGHDHDNGGRRGGHDDGPVGAPEIDPSLLGSGMVLLVGGTVVLLGQRRKRYSASRANG